MQDTGQGQEKAREVAGQAQEKVQGAAQQAKGRISEQVDQRSTQAGQQVNIVAQDVRSVAEELRSQGKEQPAQYAEQAAERVQSAGRWLEQKNGDELLRDVEDFARRNPWAVAAGGLVLGLAASRILKASSSERYRTSHANGAGTYERAGTPSGAGTLASEPMPSGAASTGARFEREETTTGRTGEFGGDEFSRQEGSMISTEPRT
ncbi:MAG TPA: hypothetical protein VFM57_13345 [Thermoleophilaceae bacterium]|nr:hypothetical protein [Thermoleophilaceae bacterium]